MVRSAAAALASVVNDGDLVARAAPVSLGAWPSASQIEFPRANFDAASNGANFSRSGWTQSGAVNTTYSNERAYSTTKALRNYYSDGSTFQFGIYFDPGAPISKLRVRVPLYIESADGSPGQLKGIRVTGSTTEGAISDEATPYIYFTRAWDGAGSMIARHNGTTNEDQTIYPSEGGGVVGDWYDRNRWDLLDFTLQPDSSAGASDGNITWANRRLDTGAIISSGDYDGLFWNAGSRHRYIVLQGYFGNSYDPPGKCFWDVPYIQWRTSGTDDLPHIMIINSASYSARDPSKDSIVPYTDKVGDLVTFPAYKGPNAGMSGLYAAFMRGLNDPYSNTAVAI